METLIKTNLKLVDGELLRSNGHEVKFHKNRYGYLMLCIGKRFLQAHRVVFYLSNGYLPEEVDHIDGNKGNNHPSNLRGSSRRSNMGNQKLRSDSKVKFKGVDFHKPTGKYRARIKRKQIGLYDCPIAAAIAYDREALKAFGEFAKNEQMMGLI